MKTPVFVIIALFFSITASAAYRFAFLADTYIGVKNTDNFDGIKNGGLHIGNLSKDGSFGLFRPKGTAFRYDDTVPEDELHVDLRHIKPLMNWLSEAFKRIKIEGNQRANIV